MAAFCSIEGAGSYAGKDKWKGRHPGQPVLPFNIARFSPQRSCYPIRLGATAMLDPQRPS